MFRIPMVFTLLVATASPALGQRGLIPRFPRTLGTSRSGGSSLGLGLSVVADLSPAFAEYNITGYIALSQEKPGTDFAKHITGVLSFSDVLDWDALVPGLGQTFSECFADTGYQAHLHSLWAYGNSTDFAAGGGCGGAFTSKHLDTTRACGAATSETAACEATAALIESGVAGSGDRCLNAENSYGEGFCYNCTPGSYAQAPFVDIPAGGSTFSRPVCQTGDLNNKFGTPTGNTPVEGGNPFATFRIEQVGPSRRPRLITRFAYEDPLVATLEDLETRSIVVHCANGERALCAALRPK